MEDVLGFCALAMTVLMLLGVSIWFCCSTVESVIKMGQRLKKSRSNVLLREIHHNEEIPCNSNSVTRKVV